MGKDERRHIVSRFNHKKDLVFMSPTINTAIDLPCGARLSNRLCKTAMTEGLADPMNRATPELETLYRRWSLGGAGLLITGNVPCDRLHPERPGNGAIDGNGGIEELRAYAKAGTTAGNHLWMQITHAGRQAPKSVNPHPLAPSAVPLDLIGDGFGAPREATEAEILDIIRRFTHAAVVARETGFTGIQVHGAHGYLISQFLSPLANRRTDAWGGSLENRARLALEIVRSIRAQVGHDFPISIKLNSADFQKNGFSNDEAGQVARWLEEAGVDLIELSGGTYEQPVMLGAGKEGEAAQPARESTRRREAYFLEYAALIKPLVKIPVMVTGGFRTLAGMNNALASGATDVIGLARPFCTDPEVANKLLAGSPDRIDAWELSLKLSPDAPVEDSPPGTRAQVETFGVLGWFCLQNIFLGRGLEPDTSMSVWEAFNRYGENEAQTVARLIRSTPAA